MIIYASTGAGTYEKAVDMAVKDFLSKGIDSVEYKNGTRHSISDYADMAIRTASKRAYFTGEGEKRAQYGKIKSQSAYLKWIRKESEKKLDELLRKGYNTSDISQYANECIEERLYDEIYTEYRVKKWSEG